MRARAQKGESVNEIAQALSILERKTTTPRDAAQRAEVMAAFAVLRRLVPAEENADERH